MKYTIDNPKLVYSISDTLENNFTGVVKDKYRDIAYYENGKFHRADGPAIIWANGRIDWYICGNLHREDGPAIEYKNGNKYWYYNHERYGWNDDFTVKSWINKWKLEIFK